MFFLFGSLAAFSQAQQFGNDIEVVGTVHGFQQSSGCQVELSSVGSLPINQQAMCGKDGSFEFLSIPRGEYNLVVRSGTSEYTQQLSLMSPHEDVEIRVPSRVTSSSNTVSVAEMRVPQKAREELEKANQAMQKGETAKADDYAKKALAKDPQFARALTLRAVLMLGRNQLASALQMVNTSVSIDPLVPTTQFVRASVLNAMGKAKEAQAAAEQGLRLSGSWQGHYELARALMGQGHFRQALAEINRAAGSAPSTFDSLPLLRASALLRVGDFSTAQTLLTEIIKKTPGNEPAVQLLQAAKRAMSANAPGLAASSVNVPSSPVPSAR